MYNNDPYQPNDAIVSKRVISVGNFPVGMLLGWASGREVVSIPTFGLWLDARPSPTPGVKAIIKVRKQKPGQQGKPWEDTVGWIKESPAGGELTLPAIGIKYLVAPLVQQQFGPQPRYQQPTVIPQASTAPAESRSIAPPQTQPTVPPQESVSAPVSPTQIVNPAFDDLPF